MKTFVQTVSVLALALGLSSIALATPCSVAPPTNNLIAGAPSSFANPAPDTNEPCTVLPLTFDNFSYDLNTGGFTTPTPTISTVLAQFFNVGVVTLGFNPNLAAGSDVGLEFRVTGGVDRVGLNYNGSGTGFVNEVVCAIFMPTGICPTAQTLGKLNVSAGNENDSATFAAHGTIWIFKDLNSGNAPFSEVVETFETTTPEPVTFVLMGAGLLAVGLMRRRVYNSR